MLAASLGAVACAWFFFAPPALGGSTSYVVTDGVSMQPRFHAGDLALVRAQSDYRVGQIVAYRNHQLGTIVLHRIIARDGSRYVFKGDNNNFVDFEHPASSQLIGALWVHLPGMGADLASVRSPALIGALFALGTLLLGGAAFTRRRRRRRRERRGGEPASPPAAPSAAFTDGIATVAVAAALAAAAPFIVLALLAFTRPSSAAISTKIPYTQQGSLGYSARPAAGPAYPAAGLRTGDPIFTHVVSAVDLRYKYRFSSATRHHVSGRASLSALLASTSGWKTTIPLGATVTFHGDTAHFAARLDVVALLALVSRVQAITGVRGSYTLTIVPRVKVAGSIGGARLHEAFAPGSRFSLNDLEIRPVTASGSVSETAEPAALFAKSATGTATARRSLASQLSLGPATLPVSLARAISLGGIALVAWALGAALVFVRPRRRGSETAAILSRYGSLIVPVERVWQLPGVAVIDVADIDALARISAHYERSILYERTEYGDAFWVSDESGQFRYAVWAQAWWEEADAWQDAAATPAEPWVEAEPWAGAEPIHAWEAAAPGEAEAVHGEYTAAPAGPEQPAWAKNGAELPGEPRLAGSEQAEQADAAPVEPRQSGLSSETLRYGTVSPSAGAWG